MNARFHGVVRLAKIILVAMGVTWAIFAYRGLSFLAEAFPSQAPTEMTPTRVLSDAQGYALLLGPAALALMLLFVRWPLKDHERAKGAASLVR